MKQSVFTENGSWYKGNLHTHTTNSDGCQTPEQRVAAYKKHGYDFLALTDHECYTAHPGLCSEDFLVLPAIERCAYNPEQVNHHCLHVLGISNHPESEAVKLPLPCCTKEPWQNLIDDINRMDQFAIIAHPVWSRMSPEELLSMRGHIGIEIYNNTCANRWRTGVSDYLIDYCLRKGMKTLLFATDDAHTDTRIDMFGGWIQVCASALTHEEIVRAIKAGSFYASTGPEIYDFGMEDGKIYIECSPCEEIHFVAYEALGRSFIEHSITSAEFTPSGKETYVRCECVDFRGRVAYSNPIYLK